MRIDVLIVTALQDELLAVLDEGDRWTDLSSQAGFPYHRTSFAREDGSPLVVAAVWTGEMGAVGAAATAVGLVDELDPACLAMCGICAGKRGDTGLGDVIVANKVFCYETGKRVVVDGVAEHQRELTTYNLAKRWSIEASYLAREAPRWMGELLATRPVSKTSQRRWLLHALHAHAQGSGPHPVEHPQRRTRCPGWSTLLPELRQGPEPLLDPRPDVLELSEAGRRRVRAELLQYPDGLPADPEFRVHVAPIATGSAVVEDPEMFQRLKPVMRKTLGLEMESAGVALVAARLERQAIVAKAVSDHADPDKDDSFREFACRASARFLLAFLRAHVRPPGQRRGRQTSDAQRPTRGFARTEPEGLPDVLQRVRQVCQLQEGERARLIVRCAEPFGPFLEVQLRETRRQRLYPIAAVERPADAELLQAFLAYVDPIYRPLDPTTKATLIHGGGPAPQALADEAHRQGVTLCSFAEYQGALLDLRPYVAQQRRRLGVDPIYPRALYVPQRARISLAGQRPQATRDALSALAELLDTPHPRFVLVLGDFGTGKTFLLRELAQRLSGEGSPLDPVLVEMRSLEKQRQLNQLLAQHLAAADIGRFDLPAFRYALSEGRVALCFDGFDELAFRISYARTLEHFDTVLEATAGNAKVVLTSRTQHFLTDREVRRALAERAERLPGYRLIHLEPFDRAQIQRFLVNRLGEAEAAERYRLLDEVKDLLGLSENPRMLGFITEFEPAQLREARDRQGEISSAKLYELLIERWLEGEVERAREGGSQALLGAQQLWDAASKLALLLWESTETALELEQVPAALRKAVEALETPVREVEGAAQQVRARSLLCRDAEGRVSFIHQSVQEWWVARAAVEDLDAGGAAALLGLQEVSDLLAEFFVGLAGAPEALAWAEARLADAGAEGRLKTNALKVQARPAVQRLREDVFLGAEAQADDGPAAQTLEGQDLSGQDLAQVDLQGADLRGARLRRTTLRGANLHGALLRGADLERADLREANLAGGDLREANLAFARLQGADLRGARWEESDLECANLLGAQLDPGVLARLAQSPRWAFGAARPDAPGPTACLAGSGPSWALAWRGDGRLFSSAYDGETVVVWDARTGTALRVLRSRGPVYALAWDPRGRTLASGGQAGTVHLWDPATGDLRQIWEGHGGPVYALAWDPRGQCLVSGGADRAVRLWDPATGAAGRVLGGHRGWVRALAWDPQGRVLASGGEDGAVRLWDPARGEVTRVLQGHHRWVRALAWDPQGRALASGGEDGTVRLWDPATGEATAVWEGHRRWVRALAWDPQGRVLASGGEDGTVRLWDPATGTVRRVLRGHGRRVRALGWDPQGGDLASVGEDGAVRLWDPATGESGQVLQSHGRPVRALAWSPRGEALASVGEDGPVRLWDSATGTVERVLEGPRGPVRALAWDPQGRALASGGEDGAVRLFNPVTGDPGRVLWGHRRPVNALAWASRGPAPLASGGRDGAVRLWDPATGKAGRALRGHGDPVSALAWDSRGRTLASGEANGALRLWNAGKGKVRALRGHSDGVWALAWASLPGGSLASGGDDGAVRLWDPVRGRATGVLRGHLDGVRALAWDPAGRVLASGGRDRTVRLWNEVTGEAVRVLEGHRAPVQALAWEPHGRALASGGDDGTVRLWNPATGACLAVLFALPEGWVAFTPEGRFKLDGDIRGSFWHAVGLCRFEPGELDPYLAEPLRVPAREPLFPWPDPS